MDLKDDAQKTVAALEGLKAPIESDGLKTVSWVKTHWVVIAGLGGFIVGCISGHFVHL